MNHLEWPAGDSSWLHIWIFDSSMNKILAEGNLTTVLRDHFSPLIFKLYRHNMSTADQFLSWGSLNFLSWHLCLCLCGSVCMHVCVFVGSSWEGWTSRSPRSTRRAGEWGQISQEFIKGHQWLHTHTDTQEYVFYPPFSVTAGIPREDGTSRTDGGCWTTGELNNMDQFCYEILLLPCDSCLYCVINPITYVLIRANQENLVQQGTAVTQGHQVYLESMVYLGLLGKKVERWVHTVKHT